MGFIGNVLGTNSDYQGSGGFNDLNKSLTEANQNVGYSTQQQKDFLTALQAQNGIGNQSSVFNQQQALANQLGLQAQGGGPNPAAAQLAQTTGQNVANQAALMAGQRGASANPGLMARNIAQQGAATQQNAAGQAAVLRAQQQLAAQQQLQGQQVNMAGLAGQQVGQQQGAINNLANMSLQNQGQILGMQQNVNNINAGVAGANQQANNQIIGGFLGATGQAAGMGGMSGSLGKAHGGMIQNFAKGGTALGVDTAMPGGGGVLPLGPQNINLGVNMAMPNVPQVMAPNPYSLGVDTTMPEAPQMPGPKSRLAQMQGGFSDAFNSKTPLQSGVQQFGTGLVSMGKNFFRPGGDTVTAPIMQGGEQTGEMVPKMKPTYSSGGKVPGKPKVFGDSENNDTVPAMLSPGEVVIPRSKVKDPKKVASFVNAILGMQLKA